MKAHVLALLLVVVHCGGESSSQPSTTTPTGQTTAATTTATATATATASATTAPTTSTAVDLSTEDKARAAILDALKRDDKEGFKKLVSTRIMSTRTNPKDFDAWYAVWKSAADKSPDKFKKITVSKEGTDFKLDEN